MLAGLTVYLSGRRWLPADAVRGKSARASRRAPLSRPEQARTALLLVLVPVLAVAAVGNFQIFNAYLVWAKASYDLNLFGFAMPVTWRLSAGGLSSIATIWLSLAFWRWWAIRWPEPSEIGKTTLGTVLMASAPLVLSAAAVQAGHGHKVSLAWAVGFQLINDLGYANVIPVSYALFTRASPASNNGLMIGVCLLQFFVANMLVGILGTLLGTLGGPLFWLLHAGLAGAAALVLFGVWRLFGGTLSSGSPSVESGNAKQGGVLPPAG